METEEYDQDADDEEDMQPDVPEGPDEDLDLDVYPEHDDTVSSRVDPKGSRNYANLFQQMPDQTSSSMPSDFIIMMAHRMDAMKKTIRKQGNCMRLMMENNRVFQSVILCLPYVRRLTSTNSDV